MNGPGQVAVATSDGYLLIFELAELPELNRGKGNKLIKLVSGAEVVAVTFLGNEQQLVITAGKRTMTLRPSDWQAYQAPAPVAAVNCRVGCNVLNL